MAITRTTMIDDDGSGTTGTIINNAWKQELYNQIDGVVGIWTTVPFNAANFSATGSMSFVVSAGNVAVNRYTIIGKTLIWCVVINAATVGGTASDALVIALPAGLTSAQNRCVMPTAQLSDTAAATWTAGMVAADVNSIHIQKVPFGGFALNTGGTYVYLTAIIELV